MMKIEFETDNAAFEVDYQENEVSRILRKIAHDVVSQRSGIIFDANGNKIGTWSLE